MLKQIIQKILVFGGLLVVFVLFCSGYTHIKYDHNIGKTIHSRLLDQPILITDVTYRGYRGVYFNENNIGCFTHVNDEDILDDLERDSK